MFSPKITTTCLMAVEGATAPGTTAGGGGKGPGKGVEPQPARKIDKRQDDATSFRTINNNPRGCGVSSASSLLGWFSVPCVNRRLTGDEYYVRRGQFRKFSFQSLLLRI